MHLFNDPELGPTPVRPSREPLMPWFPVIVMAYALAFLTLAGLSLKFYLMAHADRKEIHHEH